MGKGLACIIMQVLICKIIGTQVIVIGKGVKYASLKVSGLNGGKRQGRGGSWWDLNNNYYG